MSDIYCARCGEPWDVDTFHEALAEQRPELADRPSWRDDRAAADRFQRETYEPAYNALRARFRAEGCIALGWQATPCPDRRNEPAQRTIAELDDLCGDDVDFLASALDDAARWGLLD